jgi:hypothetical protein
MTDDEEPLDTSMSAHDGKPDAVAELFNSCMGLCRQLPDDMRLSVEIDVWEVGARDEEGT